MESEGGDALLRFRVRGGRLERTVCALDAPEAADGAVELLPEVLPV